MKLKDVSKLFLMILIAIVTRVFTLWFDKPEFAGWFNHTYYYFVQVRGLIEHGNLPYNDMPFLFYLYSIITKIIIAFGIELNAAIVASTRLVMCLVPSLIPIPIYGIIKYINGQNPVQRNQWIFIFLAGFLPFSITHMPEMLQKNMFGLLLLSILVYYSYRLLKAYTAKDFIITTMLVLLIVLSHYGTVAALVIYGIAVFIAFSIITRDLRRTLQLGSVFAICGILSIALIYLFDIQRFSRIFVYLQESIKNSLLFALFNANSDKFELLLSIGFLIVLYLIFFLFYRVYFRHKSSLNTRDKIFWLANILFCCLLILPVLDRQLMGRMVLYLSIPLLIIFAYGEKYSLKKPWLKTGSVVLAAIVVIILAIGEVMSSKIHNRNNEEIYAELTNLQELQNFTSNDLIITKTGAEHICNWFFRVKAGVITSLHTKDFEQFDNIYVLNPIQGKLNYEGTESKTGESEPDKYLFMLRNIPKPANVETLFETSNIEFFKLEKPPDEWNYTIEGNWSGYSKEN